MFERFTEGARRGVVKAQEEARRLNHAYIGTEHLLLGLLREPDEIAARALASVGLTLDEARRRVEDVVGRGQNPPEGHVPFSPGAKKAIESALREGLVLRHKHIGTEHILLGLVAQHEDVAARIMVDVAGDLGRVRRAVVGLLR